MRRIATTLESEMTPDELSFLTSLIHERAFSGKHLEVGTAAGGTLWRMIKATDGHKKRPTFVAVDPMTYFKDQAALVRKNLSDHGIDPKSVDIRQMRSSHALAAAQKNGETFDLILIDAAHKIKYVTQDIRWARQLNPGGILLFHDYLPHNKDVTWPVKRFLQRHRNYRVIGHTYSLLAIQKDGPSRRKEVSIFDHIFAWAISPAFQLRTTFQKYARKFKNRARANQPSR